MQTQPFVDLLADFLTDRRGAAAYFIVVMFLFFKISDWILDGIDKQNVLRMNVGIAKLFGALACFPLDVLSRALFLTLAGRSIPEVSWSLWIPTLIVSIFYIWLWWRWNAEVSSEGIRFNFIFRSRQFLRWQDVSSISWAGRSIWINTKINRLTKFRIPAFWQNIPYMLMLADKNLVPIRDRRLSSEG